jgi:NADPH-dependent curcumin reductase CurA
MSERDGRRSGCRTVAITGGPRQVGTCLDEFGYLAAVDYRSATFEADLAVDPAPGGASAAVTLVG